MQKQLSRGEMAKQDAFPWIRSSSDRRVKLGHGTRGLAIRWRSVGGESYHGWKCRGKGTPRSVRTVLRMGTLYGFVVALHRGV